MRPRGAFDDEMNGTLTPDRRAAERLLEGHDDPRFPGLVRLLAAASAPASADEVDGAERLAPVLAAEARAAFDAPRPARKRRVVLRVVTIAAGMLLVLSSTLAAFGALPGAAQSIARSVLSKIGVTVPGPNAHAGDHPNTRGNSTTHTPNEHANPRATVKANDRPTAPPTGRPSDHPTPSANPHR